MKKVICWSLAIVVLVALTVFFLGSGLFADEPTAPEKEPTQESEVPAPVAHTIQTEPLPEENVPFAPVMAQMAKAIRNHEATVTVTNLSLMIHDTSKLVEDQHYMIHFALANDSGEELVHIVVDSDVAKRYEGDNTFTAVQSATFSLPLVDPGEYTLVAYISSDDGTRVSEYTELMFTEIAEFEVQHEGGVLKAVESEGNSLRLIYEGDTDEKNDT